MGTVVAGRFELLKVAASGGIGTVFQAHDRAQGRLVAVKLLKQLHAEHVQRFKREAELLARLDAPGFVRYIDFGVLKGGQPFLATEWLNGEDLDARLARGPLRIDETITLAMRIASSLAVAHQHGVIHRDIKPSNLWLVDRDTSRPKILDLGLARFIDAARSSITSTGAVMGTPSYMSPEQARGSTNLDARTDVFSLGCVLYECLTGNPPFPGDQIMAILAKIVFEDAPRVRSVRAEVPRALDGLVRAMLSRDPADRPRDAGAVAAALNALQPSDVGRRHSSRPPQPALTNREQRVVCVLTATLQRQQQDSTAETDLGDMLPNHEQLRAIAEQRGGRLELLANGCLIATFSAAGQAADLALSAARTALALRPLLQGFCMALATGRAVVGDRFSIGEAVQRTAHLLDLAQPGEIRVDEASVSLLESRFTLDDRKLIGERPTPTAERLLLGRATSCVGRDWELTTLDAAFTECVEESAARLVLVTAAAGMGKTRLRHEFLRRVNAKGAAVCVGVGDPMRAGTPLGLLGSALRSCFGIHASLKERVRKELIELRVRRHVPRADTARVSGFLGELMDVNVEETAALRAARQDPLLMADQLLRAWEEWLAAESAAHPVLLIFDDMHWGDLPTVKFVDSALRRFSDRPIFVLALGRPEMHQTFPNLWAEHGATALHLRKLPRKACEQLVRQLLGTDTEPDHLRRLIDHADGNAFYLEELIRSAAEGSRELPASILAMLQMRIGALPDELRLVLRAGSVFGGSFQAAGAAHLLDDEGAALRKQLSELVQREWLTQGADGSAETGSYAFRHDLVREAAYRTLTEEDRVLGHRLAAEWLERSGEPSAIVIAENWDRAGDARAAECYRRAAEQAMEASDLTAAIARAERGVQCGATEQVLGALRVVQAEAHNWLAQHEDAERCAAEAMAALEPGSPLWAHAVHQRSWAVCVLGRHADVQALAEQLLAHPPRAAFTRLHVLAHAHMTHHQHLASLHDTATALVEPLRTLDRSTLDEVTRGTVAFALAYLHSSRGNLSQCGRLLAQASRDFQLAGDGRQTCMSTANLGELWTLLGLYADARRTLDEALERARAQGLVSAQASILSALALCVALAGQPKEALAFASAAMRLADGIDSAESALGRAYYARVLYETGDFSAAEREAREVTATSRFGTRVELAALAVHARALLAQDRLEPARESAARAAQLLEALPTVDDSESLARLVLAEIEHARDDLPAARAAIQRARERLLFRAELIDDAAQRESFLKNVPENARTLELASKWLQHEALAN